MKKTAMIFLAMVFLCNCLGVDAELVDSYTKSRSLCDDDIVLENSLVTDITNINFVDYFTDEVAEPPEISLFHRYTNDSLEEYNHFFVTTPNGFLMEASWIFTFDDLSEMTQGETIEQEIYVTLYNLTDSITQEQLESCSSKMEYYKDTEINLSTYCGEDYTQPTSVNWTSRHDVEITRISETHFEINERIGIWNSTEQVPEHYNFSAQLVYTPVDVSFTQSHHTQTCEVKEYEYYVSAWDQDVGGLGFSCPSGYYSHGGGYSPNKEDHIITQCKICEVTDQNGNIVLSDYDAVNLYASQINELCNGTSSNTETLISL